MAETQVQKQVCGACGSDIRPDSLFCYHCGGPLDVEENSTSEPSDVWFRSEIAPVDENVSTNKHPDEKKSDSSITSEEEKVEDKILEEKILEEEEKEEVAEKEDNKELDKKEETKVNITPKPFKERSKKKGYKKRSRSNKKEINTKPELKSAAALRKREKPTRLKRVEIVWEEKENSPNIWFIVFALILSAIVGVLVFFAFYLK